MKLLVTLAASLLASLSVAQDNRPEKVRHAEPLYIDLIRDLGARKGEKEWNVGWGIANDQQVITNTAFVEYEFAPINRLGFEAEVPFTFYQNLTTENSETTSHRNRIEGIKLATQYTFLVAPKHQLSMAVGYLHEFKLHSFQTMHAQQTIFKGNSYNPIFIVAKRLGAHLHTLLYTGPQWESVRNSHKTELIYQLNASVHYMTSARHFIGIELNDEQNQHVHHLTIRPQVKIVLAGNLAIGLMAGIPAQLHENGMSFMTRIIYEPVGRK